MKNKRQADSMTGARLCLASLHIYLAGKYTHKLLYGHFLKKLGIYVNLDLVARKSAFLKHL